jgi:hypothetical protein
MRVLWGFTGKAPREPFIPTDEQMATNLERRDAGTPAAVDDHHAP